MKKDENLNQKAGERLKKWRNNRGISQEHLAEKSGYSKVHISYIENGKRRMTIEAARIFSKILEIRERYLMGYDNFATVEDYRFSLHNHDNITMCISEIITESGYGFTDIESGRILESFTDPYFGEVMNVVEIDKWLIKEHEEIGNKLWSCSDQKMENFFEDIRLYIIFRLRQLIKTCEEATDEEYFYWEKHEKCEFDEEEG